MRSLLCNLSAPAHLSVVCVQHACCLRCASPCWALLFGGKCPADGSMAVGSVGSAVSVGSADQSCQAHAYTSLKGVLRAAAGGAKEREERGIYRVCEIRVRANVLLSA